LADTLEGAGPLHDEDQRFAHPGEGATRISEMQVSAYFEPGHTDKMRIAMK
jgi:hypothetical protein